jgi:hypothetical protein
MNIDFPSYVNPSPPVKLTHIEDVRMYRIRCDDELLVFASTDQSEGVRMLKDLAGRWLFDGAEFIQPLAGKEYGFIVHAGNGRQVEYTLVRV